MGKILKLEQIQREELAERSKEARPFQTWKLLIVYARQSTINQFINNKESQQEQALDLLDYGARLGWPEELRLLFIENLLADGTIKNASGRLRIDEREGLQAVFDLIKQGKVGAILVSSVDRLFRDETNVQAAVFADECKKHGVQILTLDGDIYDFNVPRREDIKDFLEEAQEAADYLKHIRRMNRRRERKALRGEYPGGNIPTGFMLDGDGKHRNYIDNPVWAPIMKKLFKHFRVDLHGNIDALRKEIMGKPLFPELPEEIRVRVGHIRLAKVPGGYSIHSWSGLRDMLINPAYIGHKLYKGRLIKASHLGIVDEEDWWFAFNLLSATDIDGNERRKVERAVRKPKSALLSGVRKNGKPTIQSRQGDVYVFEPDTGELPTYAIRRFEKGNSTFVASILISKLDAMFEEILMVRLKEVAGRGVTNTPYHELCRMQETALASVHESITRARKEHARLQREHDVNFDQMSDKELRENKAARNELLRQLEELEQKVKEAETERQDYHEVDCLLRDAGKTWAEKTLAEKQRYIRIITTSIWLEEYMPGWLRLTVFWSPIMGLLDHNECIIWRQNAGRSWSDEEKALLAENYGSKSRAWLIEALPFRSWRSIRAQAHRQQVQRNGLREEYAALPDYLCLTDVEVMKTYSDFRIEPGTELIYKWYCTPIKEHAFSIHCA